LRKAPASASVPTRKGRFDEGYGLIANADRTLDGRQAKNNAEQGTEIDAGTERAVSWRNLPLSILRACHQVRP
jgi:hypothetical protein